MKQASKQDCQLLYDWANNSEVRNNAFNSGVIKWEDHVNWFEHSIKDPNTFIFLGQFNGEDYGQIRFNFENDTYLITYSIALEYRGQGLGSKLINDGLKMLKSIVQKPIRVKALVKTSNIASAKIFKRLGFSSRDDIYENNPVLIFQKNL
ncbi:MAG: GNAT family N-acetyltransferase [Crocinitomicaceae bacterium]|nr:GNAT family N-acetyltransferase [Crocinitomicaceae bacterium]|tara:strand:+ start:24434 stop:24883 length:450 start_codon:yes stop_codon:yes gene_type:complete